MPPPLRIAVMSFWHVHAGDYARAAVQHPETELVAVWDDDVARGREAAEQYGVHHVSDLDALLSREDVDAVTVTAETNRHRDLMVAAARAGKHIFTEKLLAPTVSECQDIRAACDDNGVQLMVSLPRLHHGYTAAITDIVESGKLGQLTYGRVRLSHNGASQNWLPERFFDPEPAIGGALTDLGCHPVYLTQLFLGARPQTVSATYRAVTQRPVEDNAVVTLGYREGAIGVIEAGFVSPSPFIIEIGGTEGFVSYNDAQSAIVATGPAFGDQPQRMAVPSDTATAFQRWVQHIRPGTDAGDDEETDGITNYAAAVELTRLVAAANQSAASGRAIELIAP